MKLGRVWKQTRGEVDISYGNLRGLHIEISGCFSQFPPADATRSPTFFHVILSIHPPSFHLFLSLYPSGIVKTESLFFLLSSFPYLKLFYSHARYLSSYMGSLISNGPMSAQYHESLPKRGKGKSKSKNLLSAAGERNPTLMLTDFLASKCGLEKLVKICSYHPPQCTVSVQYECNDV